jgi:hypothetical protein
MMADIPYPEIFPAIIARAFELGAVRVEVHAHSFFWDQSPWQLAAKFKVDKTAVAFKRELKAKYPKPCHVHAGDGVTLFYMEYPG